MKRSIESPEPSKRHRDERGGRHEREQKDSRDEDERHRSRSSRGDREDRSERHHSRPRSTYGGDEMRERGHRHRDPSGDGAHRAGPSRDASASVGRDGRDRGRGSGRGGGRGGGRGRGGGGRGGRMAKKYLDYMDEFDLVDSLSQIQKQREVNKMVPMTKQAQLKDSKPVKLLANYYKIIKVPQWAIYHYRVDFQPDEYDTRLKKQMIRAHKDVLGAYVFDGSSLYMTRRIQDEPMILQSNVPNGTFQINIRLVAVLAPTDPMNLQVYNIIVRQCMEMMKLENMGRHFFDSSQSIRIDAYRLELWPGYKTSMRNHEQNILLAAELQFKVLRQDNCLQIIQNAQSARGDYNWEGRVKAALIGTIVMTAYNRKTYRVDDIDWTMNPLHTFTINSPGGQTEITYAEYFRTKYNMAIHHMEQPMLISRPKKKDLHRGMPGLIVLVPELCQMTGISDEMRSNFNLMRAISSHVQMDPKTRVQKIEDFRKKFANVVVEDELKRWGLGIDKSLVEIDGHVIAKEKIIFGQEQAEVVNQNFDWSQALKNKPMLSTVNLQTWAVIVPSRDKAGVDNLVGTMQNIAKSMRFQISKHSEIISVTDARPHSYIQAVDTVMGKLGSKTQLIFAILPRQATDIYSAVKKRACIEFGVASQCFVAKNINNTRGLGSICSKLVIQMNAKLGGEPWSLSIPLKNLMVVGFDAYHCGKRKGASVGAMVATTDPKTLGRYYSTISFHSRGENLSSKMAADFTKCLKAYHKKTGTLPDRIFMYRDGVGDGQLKYVFETELEEIKKQIRTLYEVHGGKPEPKFSFIVVTKKINTRIFGMDDRYKVVNPEPGTVVDDVITLPERYDFFLVSQQTRNGTVSPTSYNVLHDTQGLDAGRMQWLTYKLCHLYYNWSGTVAVPAPCQYAKKLAYLTGQSLGGPSSEELADFLYFL